MKKMIMFGLIFSFLSVSCFGWGWGSSWGRNDSWHKKPSKKDVISSEFYNLKNVVDGLIARFDVFETRLEEVIKEAEPSTQQKLLLKSGGDVIGELISVEQGELKFRPNDDFEIATINSHGILTGSLAEAILFYKEYDCAGQGYQIGGAFIAESTANLYTIFIAPTKNKLIGNNENLYYIPKGTSYITAKMLSYYGWDHYTGETKCINFDYLSHSYENMAFLKAMPNDPAVTGIYTYPFKTPFTVDDWPSELIIE